MLIGVLICYNLKKAGIIKSFISSSVINYSIISRPMRRRIVKFIIFAVGIFSLGWLIIYFRPVFIAEPGLAGEDIAVTAPSAALPVPVMDSLPTPVAEATSSVSTSFSVSTSSVPTAASSNVAVPVTPAVKKASSSAFIIPVPFTAQAPLGEWSDERQQDGCEEAAAAMTMAWVGGEKNIAKEDWLARILALADFEQEKYGEHRDIAAEDIIGRIFNDYYGYDRVNLKIAASSSDILKELEQGNIVLIPTDGQALKNPNFTAPGPERHMLLIKWYDYKAGQFITNDPGTRRGENYRYTAEVIFKAIRPYATGYKLPFPEILVKKIIVVQK